MAYTVREALAGDFDSVYELLKRLNNTSLGKADWARITKLHFNSAQAHYGYVLVDENGGVQGFLGTIFSERYLGGKEIKFCNIHSWIVDPEAKNGGISLLMKALRLKDYVITNFTASEAPYLIFTSLKFKEVEYKNFMIFPFQSSKNVKKIIIKIITEQNAAEILDQQDLQLFQDHKNFDNVQFIWFQKGNESSLLISKRKEYMPAPLKKLGFLKLLIRKQLFLGQLHYVRNAPFFFEIFANTFQGLRICKMLGVVGLLSSDQFIPSQVKINKKKYSSKRPYMFKHSTIEARDIDTLYSEFFVLNF